MKVAVISNSHLASLKLGQDLQPVVGVHPRFFGAGKHYMLGTALSPDGTRIVATTQDARRGMRVTAGVQYIDLHEYDAFFVYGLTVKLQTLLDVYRSHQVFGYEVSAGPELVSEALLRRIVRDEFRSTAAARILSLLAKSGKPVLFSPAPLPSEVLARASENGWMQDERGVHVLAWLIQIFDQSARELAVEYGASYMAQPAASVALCGLTAATHSTGAMRVNGRAYDDVDVDHMNPGYGRLVLDQACSALTGLI